VLVGSGKRFFPDGVRLNLELVEERRFRKGVIVLRCAARGSSSRRGWNVARQSWHPRMRRSIQGKSAANSPLKLMWPSLHLGSTLQHQR
jgi:hypothetical protein